MPIIGGVCQLLERIGEGMALELVQMVRRVVEQGTAGLQEVR